jgi:hypothetical protein
MIHAKRSKSELIRKDQKLSKANFPMIYRDVKFIFQPNNELLNGVAAGNEIVTLLMAHKSLGNSLGRATRATSTQLIYFRVI